MFELKKGMKVKNIFGNTHIFLELIDGEYWYENRTCNLETEIDWEETAKLNGIGYTYKKDLQKQYSPKYDETKLDWSLLPISEIEEIVKVLDYGKYKYEKNGWKNVEDAKNRYLSAAYRHLVEYTKGNKIDEESGLSHLSHLAANVIFLMWFENNEEE